MPETPRASVAAMSASRSPRTPRRMPWTRGAASSGHSAATVPASLAARTLGKYTQACSQRPARERPSSG